MSTPKYLRILKSAAAGSRLTYAAWGRGLVR
jgi:hypothetical protein